MPSKHIKLLPGILESLLDPAVGILGSIEEQVPDAASPNFFHYISRAANTATFTRQANFVYNGGASIDRAVAMAKAIGESIERYSSAIFDINSFPLHTYNDAPFPCTAPEEYALYSDAQHALPNFPWKPFKRDTLVRWTPAFDFTNKATIHVPACMVYLPYMYYTKTKDTAIVQPISTGMACHSTLEDAALGAICEAVERDAFTICWQSKMSPPRIRLDSLNPRNRELVRRFEDIGIKVVMLDLTLDHGIPTILTCLISQTPGMPPIVVGASTEPCPEEAARKSLEECAHTRRYCLMLVRTQTPLTTEGDDFSEVTNQETHQRFYLNKENAARTAFLYASNQEKDFSEIKSLDRGSVRANLLTVVDRISEIGERVCIADITSEDIRALGLTVVRAVVPGFNRLQMGFKNRTMGGKRLWTIPQKFGYQGIDSKTGDYPYPHPYP